jgi:hypothetical protein
MQPTSIHIHTSTCRWCVLRLLPRLSQEVNCQGSDVYRLLTNPNALCVTAGMEYISACVYIDDPIDTTSARALLGMSCRLRTDPCPSGHANYNKLLNKASLYFKVTHGSDEMLLVSWVLELPTS